MVRRCTVLPLAGAQGGTQCPERVEGAAGWGQKTEKWVRKIEQFFKEVRRLFK